MSEPWRAVSFDLDGTLYERPALWAALRRLAWERWREPLRSWAELRALARARAGFEQARRGGGRLGAAQLARPRDELLALEARWVTPGIRRAGLRAGVGALLADLERRRIPLALVTDHPVQGKLDALGLEGRFPVIVVAEALGVLKPHPQPLLSACAALGIEPAALLHVGDRPETDGESARLAGAGYRFVPAAGALDPGWFGEDLLAPPQR